MRLEIVASVLSFAMSSAFWLLAALRMEPSSYGVLMQWQSLLMIGAAFFAWRTHDLVFHLQREHGAGLREAYLVGVRLELMLACGGAVVAVLLLIQAPLLGVARPTAPLLLLAALGLLSNITCLQGSPTAYLRARALHQYIAYIDLGVVSAWAVALAVLLASPHLPPLEALALALGAASTRALLLILVAWRNSRGADIADPHAARPAGWRSMARFLVAGQSTHLLKNNLVSIETLLLGRLSGPDAVALFRVAKSFQSLTSVLLNVTYQRAYAALHHAEDHAQRRQVVGSMTRKSLLMWAGALPVIFLAAFAFLHYRDHPAYAGLYRAVGLCALAALPLALQQSDFANLTLTRRLSRIVAAYGAGLALLLLGCVLFHNQMTTDLFIGLTVVAGFVRYAVMHADSTGLPGGTSPERG